MAAKTLQDELRSITADAKRQRVVAKAFYKRFGFVANLVDGFSEDNPDLNVGAYFSVRFGGSLNFTFYSIDSFRNPALTDLLANLEGIFGVEFTMTDNAASLNKTFTAAIDWEEGQLDIRVSASIAYGSPNCERVVVGLKMVEVPEYELRCNDLEEELSDGN